MWRTPTGHTYTIEPEPPPVGRWSSPSIQDDWAPITDLIDLDPDPPLWETTATDTLPPDEGHELLLRHHVDALTAGPAP